MISIAEKHFKFEVIVTFYTLQKRPRLYLSWNYCGLPAKCQFVSRKECCVGQPGFPQEEGWSLIEGHPTPSAGLNLKRLPVLKTVNPLIWRPWVESIFFNSKIFYGIGEKPELYLNWCVHSVTASVSKHWLNYTFTNTFHMRTVMRNEDEM